jgi:dihydroorotate dehydrogenase (fumarate)
MDLSVNYMGMKLKNPLVVSSSKLTKDFDSIKFCEEMGAGAVVTKSFYEEQLQTDDHNHTIYQPGKTDDDQLKRGMHNMLEMVSKVKSKLEIPLIASINCINDESWGVFAKKFEEAGADAIELNIAIIPFDKNIRCEDIYRKYIEILKIVKNSVKIPVSVKIGSYFTNIPSIVHALDDNGADAIVLFNRFYRPDINIETEEIVKFNTLSGSSEATKSLRWIAVLSPEVKCDLSAGGGVHDYKGVIKQLLVGASNTQLCSALFKNGVPHIGTIIYDVQDWMDRHGYRSIDEFKGKIQKKYGEGIAKFERTQYSTKDS